MKKEELASGIQIDVFDDNPKKIMEELREPFPLESVYFRGLRYTRDKKKALTFVYIDARAVMDRLDKVFGMRWTLDTIVSETKVNNYVAVQAEIRVGMPDGTWVSRTGYGSSDVLLDDRGNSTNDPVKSAESDAIKRAAVSFGIGRYLYALPQLWLDWDEDNRRFAVDPASFFFDADGKPKANSEVNNSSTTPASSGSDGNTSNRSSRASTRGGGAPGASGRGGSNEETPPELLENIMQYYESQSVDLIGENYVDTCQRISSVLCPDVKPSAAQIKYIVGLSLQHEKDLPEWEKVDKREANNLIKSLQ